MDKAVILKKAIILEQQGQSFYGNIAEQTESDALRQIFRTMTGEEKIHEKTLKKQLEGLDAGRKIGESGIEEKPYEFADAVLTQKVLDEISGSSFEAAAISAAMELEIKTVDFYNSQSETAGDEDERTFFKQLSEWEGTHLRILSKMNRDILENALNEEIY